MRAIFPDFGILRAMMAIAALAFVVLAHAPAAKAAASTYGSTLAFACYQGARSLHGDSTLVRICTRALEDDALTPAQRAHTLVNRGIAQILRGDADAALADYAAAEGILPGLAEARVNRGLVYLRQGEYETAISEIRLGQAAGCIEPAPCLYALALARELEGDLAGAYRDLQGTLALDADFTPAKQALARFRVERRAKPAA
jgi:tetratricopeptide (TPR) repeat protein